MKSYNEFKESIQRKFKAGEVFYLTNEKGTIIPTTIIKVHTPTFLVLKPDRPYPGFKEFGVNLIKRRFVSDNKQVIGYPHGFNSKKTELEGGITLHNWGYPE